MGVLNFEGIFGKAPAPFTIKVDPDFVASTKRKVSLTRMVEDVDQPDYSDGPPIHIASAVKDYWAREYDWESVQDRLNSEYVLYGHDPELLGSQLAGFHNLPQLWIYQPAHPTRRLFLSTLYTILPLDPMQFHYSSFTAGQDHS